MYNVFFKTCRKCAQHSLLYTGSFVYNVAVGNPQVLRTNKQGFFHTTFHNGQRVLSELAAICTHITHTLLLKLLLI